MNKDQWDNDYEFARTFGDFEDTTLYDPYGGEFDIFISKTFVAF